MEGDIKFSYETLWKFIIRPPRDEYTESMLGKKIFKYNSKHYERKDYDIMSTQGYILKCSFIEPTKAYRPSVKMPVVVYLHGNSSSRIEGLNMTKVLLKRDINLFVFDFAGSGLSEGEYISLGYHESDDVGNVIDFLEKIPGVGKIGIWGRSMGAATGMLYAHRDKRIRAMCLDSPFADFERLAKELTKKNLSFNLPGFIIGGMLSIVRGTILKKNGLDIDKLKPIDVASKTTQPIIFVHAIKDELIDVKHSMDLFNMYGGQQKSLKCCDNGGHNSKRDSSIIKMIGDFFAEYLCNNSNNKKEKLKISNDKNIVNFNMKMNYNFNHKNNNINNINNNINNIQNNNNYPQFNKNQSNNNNYPQFNNNNYPQFNYNNNQFNNNNNQINNNNNEEDEIIINESNFSMNEIKGINPKFKDDNNSNEGDDIFDEQNTERMNYIKKREKMDKQRFSDMMTMFKSIKPDIQKSFKNPNANNNNNIKNDSNNNLPPPPININTNFNQQNNMNQINNNNNLNNNMFNNKNINNYNNNNFYNNFNNYNNNNFNNNMSMNNINNQNMNSMNTNTNMNMNTMNNMNSMNNMNKNSK